jgi:S-adenosylmethionine:tRNA ribosyltransferase-isomerase
MQEHDTPSSDSAAPLTTADFDYALDESLVAQSPLAQRDESRLMVLHRGDGRIGDRRFSELPSLLRRGDLLVLNDTRVIPAKFFCRRGSGGRIEGLFLRETRRGEWEVLLKNAGRCKAGESLAMTTPDGGETAAPARIELKENAGEGRWLIAAAPAEPAAVILERLGITPLPPYIRRAGQSAAGGDADRPRYQTVYARAPGAVAAPTAGLHFTPRVFEALSAAGVLTARVTLHVGLGTFLPVKVERLASHAMHSEWYELSGETAAQLTAARREGRRIVAVGTTSVRVLETAAAQQASQAANRGQPRAREFAAASGWTDIFLYPPREFRAVDALLTNFHLPRSTLLMLVAAFCSPGTTDGLQTILAAYAHAQAERYRFFSYGDAMLIV